MSNGPRADIGERHQAPVHIIVPDDGWQVAVQYAELFAKYPPDNEQRLDQLGHVGEILDQLPDARLELDRVPTTPTLRPKFHNVPSTGGLLAGREHNAIQSSESS